MHMHVLERIKPGARVAGPESIELPTGYRIEPLLTSLNYPTSITWDVDGNLLIAESEFPYGRSPEAEPRILRRQADGSLEPLSARFDRPIADITVYQGLLYVSHRGAISLVEDGRVRDLITGLPSWGLNQNSTIVFGQDGRMYFGQGTVSNAGVLGPEEIQLLYEAGHPAGHDIPGADVVLAGKNLESMNPLTGEVRPTGAFVPWGRLTTPQERIPGARPGQAASGAIMSANLDGSDLRVFAWGLRNPVGLVFGADGLLYASNQGAKPLEPRPVAGDPDTLWVVEEGCWYGWPDFFAGRPVTDPIFHQPDGRPGDFLIANHQELLKGRSVPPQPIAQLGLQASVGKLDVCLHPEFGFGNQLFLAEFGSLLTPEEGGPPWMPQGHRVTRIDPIDGAVSDFAINRSRMPASLTGNNGGLERPLEAKFGPDGNLYIVDFGVVEYREGTGGWVATPRTGIIWQVTHTGHEE